jgi:N6-L-threonylcarbamoyladenine synthase
MYILAFETSCDDTSVAIMCDDECIALSTRTQLEHDVTGGVVPEVAARSHANAIFPCIEDVLSEAHIALHDIDSIACTQKPGLLPSLLTGMTVAKTLSLSLDKPLIWVDHIEGHIFANYLGRREEDIIFPAVVLTVSWGHTEIYLWKSMFELEIIGQTRDDAAGECFDKVAKMMWLGFPGGAKIAKLASEYENKASIWLFPEVMLEKQSLDFSFSWLKSAVKREIDKRVTLLWSLSESDMKEIAFEFEHTVTDILSKKLHRAVEQYSVKMILLAWWVSANTVLRSKLEKVSKIQNIPFLAPTKSIYSMDNAAMIGIRAYYQSLKWG